MNDLAMALVRLCKHNRDGAFATQANRRRGLVAMANELHALGYRMPKAQSLKPKHVHALVNQWQANGLAAGTIKNRLGWLRWWAAKVNKSSVLPRTNAELGIKRRQSRDDNRAWQPTNKLANPLHQAVLNLMATSGLRLEEAIKFRPVSARQGDALVLKGSWTKGGRARTVPLVDDQAVTAVAAAAKLAGRGALIPANQSYIQFRRSFEAACRQAGIKNVHGLRHQWAQMRYAQLTGWGCPKAGGPTALTRPQQLADRAARQELARELGHNRISITKVYLG
jgi:site-specific recombinase XerC